MDGALGGHSPPSVVSEVQAQVARGITMMLPTEDSIVVAKELAHRFRMPYWQFTLSATDANRSVLRIARQITGRRLWTLTGESRGDGFGTSPSVAGDIDGDGYADLIVGAWQYGGAAVSGGRAYLYSGRTHELLRTYTCRIPGDTFGFDAVGLGDVDGDGVDDLLITSGWSAVSGHHSGRVFLSFHRGSQRARHRRIEARSADAGCAAYQVSSARTLC